MKLSWLLNTVDVYIDGGHLYTSYVFDVLVAIGSKSNNHNHNDGKSFGVSRLTLEARPEAESVQSVNGALTPVLTDSPIGGSTKLKPFRYFVSLLAVILPVIV